MILTRTSIPDHVVARYAIPALPAQLMLIGSGLMTGLRRLLPELKPAWQFGAGLAVVVVVSLADARTRQTPFVENAPWHRALERVAHSVEPGDQVTYSPYHVQSLFEIRAGLESAPLEDLISNPSRPGAKRLIVLATAVPLVIAEWSKYFELDEVGGPPYRVRVYILTSPPLPGHENPIRESLRRFLLAYEEAAAQGARLDRIPIRHYIKMRWVHRDLARLAKDAGDEEGYTEHERLRQHYLDLQSQVGWDTTF
jgi:hypothetical protein